MMLPMDYVSISPDNNIYIVRDVFSNHHVLLRLSYISTRNGLRRVVPSDTLQNASRYLVCNEPDDKLIFIDSNFVKQVFRPPSIKNLAKPLPETLEELVLAFQAHTQDVELIGSRMFEFNNGENDYDFLLVQNSKDISSIRDIIKSFLLQKKINRTPFEEDEMFFRRIGGDIAEESKLRKIHENQWYRKYSTAKGDKFNILFKLSDSVSNKSYPTDNTLTIELRVTDSVKSCTSPVIYDCISKNGREFRVISYLFKHRGICSEGDCISVQGSLSSEGNVIFVYRDTDHIYPIVLKA